MAGTQLTQLLLDLTQRSQPLTDAESLDEYQRIAKDVCRTCTIDVQQLDAVRSQLQGVNSHGWRELAEHGVLTADATKTLNALMRYGSSIQACTAAVVYSWLLRAPEAPVHHMLDTLTFSGCLQRIKESVFASTTTSSKGKGKAGATQQQHAEASDAEDDEASSAAEVAASRSGSQAVSSTDYELSLCLCYETLMNLAAMAQQTPLKSCEEVLAAGLEGCTDFLSCTKTAKVPSGSKGQGLLAGSVSAAAYALLEALFDPKHGSMEDMAASLLPRLTPLMVGAAVPAAWKRTATEIAATRAAAVDFIKKAYSRHPSIQDAVAALARHICLKAQDKADSRTAAVKACAELVVDLPQWEQEQFVGFVYKLSTSKQLGLRTLSVGLANHLLVNLPEPFKRTTFAAAQVVAAAAAQAADELVTSAAAETGSMLATATPAPTRVRGAGRTVPEGMVAAPWSVVALAALLHRCSDKSAVVRGRALADLAEIVDCFASLLAEDPSSEQYQVAEAFVEGLEAAAAMQVPSNDKVQDNRQQRKKRRAADEEGDSDEEEDAPRGRGRRGQAEDADDAEKGDAGNLQEDPEETKQDRPQRHRRHKQIAIFVAYIPHQLSADVNSITSLVHRRCGDTKAAVRKGALQLLEALLVMRASWQGYPRQLPGSADLALLEAATADPLVSVRKAALVALSTLLELFPAEPSLCQAWVASVLPLVRDVEVAVQDSLVDWAGALLFDKAAAVGSSVKQKGSKAKAVAAASADDMDWQAEGAAEAEGHAGSPAAAATYAELRQLLAAVAGVGRAAGACLGKLCASMTAKRKLKATAVARGLEAVIAGTPAGSPSALGAWILLKELAAQDPAAPSWQFLQKRWAAVRATAAGAGHSAAAQALETISELDEQHGVEAKQSSSTGIGLADEAASLLLVISQTAAGFPAEQAEELAAELLQHILSFHLPPTAAGAHVSALFKLTEATASGGSGSTGAPAVWAKQVYTAAHEHLRRYIDMRSGSAATNSNAITDHTSCVAMFTVGEVALLKAKPPSGLTVLLQALTAHNFIPSSAGPSSSQYYGSTQAPHDRGNACQGTQLQTGPDAHDTEVNPADGPASAHMLATQAVFAGGSQSGTQLIGGTQGVPLTQAVGGSRAVPSCVQGHAWIALGKVCMVDEGLAKKCVPLFVQELGRSPYPVVRNNIMVALSDMLIQYTALVDAHMPRLAACIRDRHELVRRQALALLANLLMKDYVKWRGPLFHRFLLAIVDPSPAVRQLAEYLLKDVIAVKAPLLAYNHFVEALFVLNGCAAGLHGARLGANMGSTAVRVRPGGVAGNEHEEGSGDDASAEGGSDEELPAAPAQFTLKGRHKRASRDIIYSALLRSMSPEHKFSSAAKLCVEVLAGVADGLLPLTECEEVLRDALCLLASKDIKVSANRLAAHDEDELPAPQGGSAAAGGSATAAEAAARARGKLVSALMKRHLVEQVVPVLVELRRLLAEMKHPLLSELMACFAALLKEYKGEVEDILVADKQLAKEILYDIKQAELAKAQQQQQQAAAAAAAASSRPSSAATEASAMIRNSPPPLGVMPGTPAAAEVLATAEKLRRQQLRAQQQDQQVPGDMPAPPPRPPGSQHTPGNNVISGGAAAAGALQTPAPASGCRSGFAAAGGAAGSAMRVMKTPAAAAKTPGSAAGGGFGGRMSLTSPAPVTVCKTGSRGRRKSVGGAGDENDEPEGRGVTGVPSVSRQASHLLHRGDSAEPTNILLPSPYKTNTPRQWNIPQHVATGEKQQQRQQANQSGGVQVKEEPQQQRQRRGTRQGKTDAFEEKDEGVAADRGRGQSGSRKGGRSTAAAADGGDDTPVGGTAAEGKAGRAGRSRKGSQLASPSGTEAGAGTKTLRESSRRTTRTKQDVAVSKASGDAVAVKFEGTDSSVRKPPTRKRRNV